MNIFFYFECGQIPEIGTGHKYRCSALANELAKRGHNVAFVSKDWKYEFVDVLVIDHLFSQKELIKTARKHNTRKIVLIDGSVSDVKLADESISAAYNDKAKYTGIDYMAFESGLGEYDINDKSNNVLINLGGFDANNYADIAIEAALEFGVNAVVAKSINHDALQEKYKDNKSVIFKAGSYWNMLKGNRAAITNGGLAFFQGLKFGMPTVCVPQYGHQYKNMKLAEECCLYSRPAKTAIIESLNKLFYNDGPRKSLSVAAKSKVDGSGLYRVCDIIEK